MLASWRADPTIFENISAWKTFAPSTARFVPFPAEVHPDLADSLNQNGISALYSHQYSAWLGLNAGKDVIIVTATSSGKSLCYDLPVLNAQKQDPNVSALYLFPTKALAQDQFTSLKRFTNTVAIYDGDTPTAGRKKIRENARIILTNPDMLHTGILPHHTNWASFFQNLRFVVIDEMHTYRGVFGSHFANVIRRLKRIAAFYGGYPQFILTSASIANPIELAEKMIEPENGSNQLVLINDDGSPHGEKHFIIYNPPIVDKDLGLRLSASQEAQRLASDLLANGLQTILFTRSRRSVEMLLTYLRERNMGDSGPSHRPAAGEPTLHTAIRGYRSGYLPSQRREIEQGLRQGQVRAVVATNALELGIDIGQMGAAVLVGYPGSIAAAWQQAGRAGRTNQGGLAILVASADPIDQFLSANPDYFFGRSHEQVLIDPDNLLILLSHIRCAAFELPFMAGERFGRTEPVALVEFLDFLSQQGDLYQSGGRYYWMADKYPAQDISLRSASTDNILLQTGGDDPHIIGQLDRQSALWLVHPQAIYIHEGQSYLVEDLDLQANVARLTPSETEYFTLHLSETTVECLELVDSSSVPGGMKSFGDIKVTGRVVGYRKVRWHTLEQLGSGELDLPPTELLTTAYWWNLSPDTVDQLRASGLWRNDPNDYGPSWPRQRERARQRDGYRCQSCGAEETTSSHDVHHKIPFRAFSTSEAANQLENLVTLCQSCHRRAEAAVRIRSGLAGLGFILRNLAPIFLMCDQRDLGVQTDPQSTLADGQPTVVIYDQIPAGIGLSKRLYENHSQLIPLAFSLISSCPCADGCPSCVGPGGEYGLGGKNETLAILKNSL